MLIYDIFKKNLNKNKVLYKNFSSLSLLQISQYLFPLITFPYLVRVLGPEGYGLVAFATAFVGYFTVLTDYGFNLSATRSISIHRNNSEKISEIFCSVLTVKIILFVLSILILLPVVYSFTKFSTNFDIYIVSFISVLGTTLFPIWFFQGMEKMSYISTISIIVKSLWVISVFVFIHTFDDLIILVVLNSLSSILTGIVGMGVVKYQFNVKFKIPNSYKIKHQFEFGWYYFISQVSISFYTITNIFLLGLFGGDILVGYFSAANKIRLALQNFLLIPSKTIFPHLAFKFKKSNSMAFNLIRKMFFSIGSITIFFSLLVFIFSDQIVFILLGDEYVKSIYILKLFSFLPIIIFISNILGIQIMVNMGFKKEYFRVYLLAGIFSIIFNFIFIPIYFEIGAAIVVIISEVLVASLMIKFFWINIYQVE